MPELIEMGMVDWRLVFSRLALNTRGKLGAVQPRNTKNEKGILMYRYNRAINHENKEKVAVMLGLSLLTTFTTRALAEHDGASGAPKFSVFATGLNNPRGLKFGPGGYLYVAEGGVGGVFSTVGECEQVPPPVGPYTGSENGSRISKISRDGKRTTVVDNLPFSQTTAMTGGFVSGVGDIAFLGDTLYAVLSGAGCSHGVPDIPNGVLRVNRNGSTSLIANLSAFQQANPVANPNPGDFEPDGTWYSMVSFKNALYAVEPNHGELDKINRDGQISRVIDISASEGHVVPTAMVVHGNNFYVGTLTEFPATPEARVYRITLEGEISVVADGLTAVLGVDFRGNELYVLETSAPVSSPGPPVLPGTGRVVRVTDSGVLEPVVTGLTFPTAMTFGPEGDLYISNFGFGFPEGSGEILRVHFGRAREIERTWFTEGRQ
jgi:hypothetical protein